jgi:hypothetical protein
MSGGIQYKQSHIINWHEYNQALVNRGSINFWFPEEVAKTWFFTRRKIRTGLLQDLQRRGDSGRADAQGGVQAAVTGAGRLYQFGFWPVTPAAEVAGAG